MAYDAFISHEVVGSNVSDNQTPVKTGAAMLLAYLAAAPLLAAALIIVAMRGGSVGDFAASFMALYGAALIIFFGGVRWGVAVMKPKGPTLSALFGAAAPLLVGLMLVVLSFDPVLKFPALMFFIAILLVDDLRATRRGDGAPAWYLSVRLPLTALIEVAFLVALVGRQ